MRRITAVGLMLAVALPVLGAEHDAKGEPVKQTTKIWPTAPVAVSLGDPVTVVQAPANVGGWGPYQFPGLERLPDGRIQVSFQVGADSATAVGLPPMQAVSADAGKTWTVLPPSKDPRGAVSCTQPPLLLANGERIQIKMLPPIKADSLQLPVEPVGKFVCYGHTFAYYRPADLPATARDGWQLYRFTKDGTAPVEERATMRLPGELRVVTEGVLPPPWYTGHRLLRAPDDAVWAIGEDCRVVDGKFSGKWGPIIMRSTDQGRSFDFWGEIPYQPEPAKDRLADSRAGFTEPCFHFLPDGTVVCFLRTTDGNGVGPMYWSRSADNGRTWSKPVVFDDLGVWPQALTLKNGVTLLAYGRPGLFVRATRDSGGKHWDPRVEIVKPGQLMRDTCSYCSLLPLSDDTALIAYSEFSVPGPDGTPRKSIRVRRVKAIAPSKPNSETASLKNNASEQDLSRLTTRELLAGLPAASPAEKAARVQALYDRAAFSPSGIMYSMQHLADGEVRPFEPRDFEGAVCINAEHSGLKLDGGWDYLHGENAITHSGIYLASQAYRIQVEDTPDAREQAVRAFRSLELIYEMGVKEGKPGWMCKPYGFRPSNQTSPDQYLDACWGLYAYHKVAPADHRRKIEEMVTAFADYWRRADYKISYFGNAWSIDNGGYGNATLVLINALAHRYTGRQAYLDEARRLLGRADWLTGTAVTKWRARLEEERRNGRLTPHNESPIPFATPLLKPGEVFFWESAILCKYVAVAAEILQETHPELIGGRLPAILGQWWEQGNYGTGDDLLPYYWFAADFLNGTWRPLPSTPMLPREKWAFGDPFFGCISQVRWNEPLARSIVTSVIACRHAPAVAERARELARRIIGALDETRLHWMVDPDGQQLPPEIRYYGQCLSSEMGASFLAAYWRGCRDGLWNHE